MASESEPNRADALTLAIENIERVLDTDGNDRRVIGLAGDHLLRCLEAVLAHDEDSLRTDAALQELVVRARGVHARARSALKSLAASSPTTTDAPRSPLSPAQSRVLIDRHGLRRCRECDGDLLLVRDDAVIATPDHPLHVTVVACGRCGDVRLRMRDAESLDRALANRAWQLVTMPGGTPFRSG